MKILNLVVTKSGVVNNVESFPILDSTDVIVEDEIVEKVEKLFEEWCIRNGWGFDEYENNMKDLIDNGYWESTNYDAIFLTWSNVYL